MVAAAGFLIDEAAGKPSVGVVCSATAVVLLLCLMSPAFELMQYFECKTCISRARHLNSWLSPF